MADCPIVFSCVAIVLDWRKHDFDCSDELNVVHQFES